MTGQNVSQNIDPLGRRSNQSGAGVLAASFGYNDTNGVGSLGSITTYQGAVTSNNGTLSGSGAAVTSFGFDPATGLPTSKTYAGQGSPTDSRSYNGKFQFSSTDHGTNSTGSSQAVHGSSFIYNPAGELTTSSLTDTATGDVLTRGLPQLDAKGRPQVFSQSTLDTNGATTGSGYLDGDDDSARSLICLAYEAPNDGLPSVPTVTETLLPSPLLAMATLTLVPSALRPVTEPSTPVELAVTSFSSLDSRTTRAAAVVALVSAATSVHWVR